MNSLDEHYTTEFAQQDTITLPDASEVFLNAGSELTFSENNWDDNKKSLRFQGEAYFKVAKGKVYGIHPCRGSYGSRNSI